MARVLLQRRAPLPARAARADADIRRTNGLGRSGDAHDAVAGQPFAPVFVPGAEFLADEFGARTRAIDEEVGAQLAAVLELQLFDESVFAQRRVGELALEADHAGALGERAQVTREQRGIDVQRVAQVLRDTE
jgi:hypothetical protein